MAIEILFGKNVVHKYYHDLESLFYVLIWICTMQSGPRGQLRNDKFEYRKTILSLWNGGFPGMNYPFKMVAMAKKSCMDDPKRFEVEILNHIAPYFEPIKYTLKEFRTILFPIPLVDEDAKTLKDYIKRPIPENVHKVISKLIPPSMLDPRGVFDAFRSAIDQNIVLLRSSGVDNAPPPSPTTGTMGGKFYVLYPVAMGDEKVYRLIEGHDVNEVPESQNSLGIRHLFSSGSGSLKRLSASDDSAPANSSKRIRSIPSTHRSGSGSRSKSRRDSYVMVPKTPQSFQLVIPDEDDVFFCSASASCRNGSGSSGLDKDKE